MQDLNDKITGGTLTADEWNEIPSEIQNVIEALGITLSGADLGQLNKAIAGYASHGDYYTESGVADAYVLAPTVSKTVPPSYTAGFRVRFIAGNVNTGSSTINVGGLGVKSIKDLSGNDPDAGAINGSMILVYDGTNFVTSGPGISNISNLIFTSGGSYTKPAGLRFVEVISVGAGGAGGGANTVNDSFGGGGGGGGLASSIINASDLAVSETVIVGAGGVGSTGDGTDGGDSSFGSLVIAEGGTGGDGDSAGVGGVGGAGGSGTVGDIQRAGSFGSHSAVAGLLSGGGGSSAIGGAAGGTRNADTSGIPGSEYGGGGGGGARRSSNNIGGGGGDGVIIIKEFF